MLHRSRSFVLRSCARNRGLPIPLTRGLCQTWLQATTTLAAPAARPVPHAQGRPSWGERPAEPPPPRAAAVLPPPRVPRSCAAAPLATSPAPRRVALLPAKGGRDLGRGGPGHGRPPSRRTPASQARRVPPPRAIGPLQRPQLSIGCAARPSAPPAPLREIRGAPTCASSGPNRRRDEPGPSRCVSLAGQERAEQAAAAGRGSGSQAGPSGTQGGRRRPVSSPGRFDVCCCCWKWRHRGGARGKRKRPSGLAAADSVCARRRSAGSWGEAAGGKRVSAAAAAAGAGERQDVSGGGGLGPRGGRRRGTAQHSPAPLRAQGHPSPQGRRAPGRSGGGPVYGWSRGEEGPVASRPWSRSCEFASGRRRGPGTAARVVVFFCVLVWFGFFPPVFRWRPGQPARHAQLLARVARLRVFVLDVFASLRNGVIPPLPRSPPRVTEESKYN